ncbi:uncharacterized protein LTR77_008061 [Saxophila tyrrhenica]|uniref:SH3 domain-containing protein n=1 Tax=Saxophila tyrrhenica TaxID=1690608 RepID=A0AAV9P1R9_9PEZI|nr:hypothetical protein LTR77_008061 [Saxophila tyrrhenica]
MGAPEQLPAFPCWCRATYSWGGESKKDLGFIEGDLIEALNAGDGLWWMGRLRRDPRAIGLFPSNFVKVLEGSFQPAPNSRNPSPLTKVPSPQKTPAKSGVFRKPFQAYDEVGKRPSLDGVKGRNGTPENDKKSKFRPYSSMKTAQAPTGTLKKDSNGRPILTKEESTSSIPAPPPRSRSRSPMPPPSTEPPLSRQQTHMSYHPPPAEAMYRAVSPQPGYRAVSPAPSRTHSPLPGSYNDGSAYPQLIPSRGPSPNPYQQQAYRAPSPQPQDYFDYQGSRVPSPAPYEEDDLGSSPPPPPPPTHRVVYQPTRAPSPQPYRTRTPEPPSPGPGAHGMTPSPLRDAMNDVMSSLQDMSVLQRDGVPLRNEAPVNVWSPDEFEMVRTRSQQQHQRAQSSLGFTSRQNSTHGYGGSQTPSVPSSRDGPPQLEDFVQRMERQLRHTKSNISYSSDNPPAPPLKGSQYATSRPTTSGSSSSQGSQGAYQMHSSQRRPNLRQQKSAYELGRTYTTKTNVTNSTESSSATQSSNSTQLTSRSIMSGYSAGGFSATSAGSLARKRFGLGSQRSKRGMTMMENKSTPDISSSARSVAMSEVSGPSYHESHASANFPVTTPTADWTKDPMDDMGALGGLSAVKAKKSNFFRKMMESARSTARTGAASARSTIGSRPGSRSGSVSPTKGITGIAGGLASRPGSSIGAPARDMGLGGGAGDWMQVRRDVNRSNSLSRREREERAERCEMMDLMVMNPIDQLLQMAEGDESLDGLPVTDPTDFNTPNLALVDKSTRFIQSVPPMINAAALAQSYICRPQRSDVQRARAIFTWVAERITWEEDFEGQVDTRRVIQTKRGCSEEIAVLVRDMCNAVGLQAEVIRGYLKGPGEVLDLDTLARPNHWWNAVIVDHEWRIMDCSLAGPTHPKRGSYSGASSQVAEPWYFLARPMEVCYTHIPLLPEQQHIVPPVPHEVLCALPYACPTYFRNDVELSGFDNSILHLDHLEMTHLHINVPEDVECVAETEARSFAQDADGDYFESGEMVKKKALAQPEWVAGRKRYTIKALLPGDDGQGVLKIYAGKRGLMHSIKDNPHSLALAVPLTHTGQNPPYDFLTRHPTPHAQRHDLYIAQPQCARLVLNNTFVFCVRQHPSSLSRFTPDTWGSGGNTQSNGPPAPYTRPGSAMSMTPYARPGSAMSMVSATVSQSGSSNYSDGAQGMTAAQQKPAKLAIQSPSQKIIRLTRKQEHMLRGSAEEDGLTTSWETVIKVGERGTWRGLVLADRSARWCVFGEWECV